MSETLFTFEAAPAPDDNDIEEELAQSSPAGSSQSLGDGISRPYETLGTTPLPDSLAFRFRQADLGSDDEEPVEKRYPPLSEKIEERQAQRESWRKIA
ncbi:hypothetical protein L202_03123 [Cryptococcus amylolentus CBS 6039]|uniref:Uncharacterized protein n=1 Tax=Cryptococcus amylolentus CBS 6039 TaxID=1295533 RepID=A0A1E3HXF7_9TREE|nr:hypothetical protein L202_03123 [Cryptococcus amylolentus CBS 6039]ODN81023.1 hypothetical protein L202_03123 [Cryptococcus amylolentus CBS 6039]